MKKVLTLSSLQHFLSKIKEIFVWTATGTTEGNVVVFGADGKIIRDSGHKLEKDVPANAKFTDTTYTVATTSKDGLLSKTDKAKLDGLENIDISEITTAEIDALFV